MKDLECHFKNVLYSQNMVLGNLHQSPLGGLLKMHMLSPSPVLWIQNWLAWGGRAWEYAFVTISSHECLQTKVW